jgi:hypothetical protein
MLVARALSWERGSASYKRGRELHVRGLLLVAVVGLGIGLAAAAHFGLPPGLLQGLSRCALRNQLGSCLVRIEFPPGETDDTTRWIVWFLAVVNGKQIHCGISYQALRTHFAADFHDPLPAFVAHRHRIEAYITDLIRQGRFEEDETIVIRVHDVPRSADGKA